MVAKVKIYSGQQCAFAGMTGFVGYGSRPIANHLFPSTHRRHPRERGDPFLGLSREFLYRPKVKMDSRVRALLSGINS